MLKTPTGWGWSLPLASSADGTSSLTFNAHVRRGNPPWSLWARALIVGFVFLEADAEIVDDKGQPADLVLEPWTYPADIAAPSTDAPWLEGVTQNPAGSIVLTFTEGVNVTGKSGAESGPGAER